MCDHLHEQPSESPEDDDPLKRWKAGRTTIKRTERKHTGIEFLDDYVK
jgi:hypothetical protein